MQRNVTNTQTSHSASRYTESVNQKHRIHENYILLKIFQLKTKHTHTYTLYTLAQIHINKL